MPGSRNEARTSRMSKKDLAWQSHRETWILGVQGKQDESGPRSDRQPCPSPLFRLHWSFPGPQTRQGLHPARLAGAREQPAHLTGLLLTFLLPTHWRNEQQSASRIDEPPQRRMFCFCQVRQTPFQRTPGVRDAPMQRGAIAGLNT